jgi:hypothetical protein
MAEVAENITGNSLLILLPSSAELVCTIFKGVVVVKKDDFAVFDVKYLK